MVKSPNGRMYHCNHSGHASIAGEARTIGVAIANTAAMIA